MTREVRCKFWIEWVTPEAMMISDVGDGSCPTITNDAEAVVKYLRGCRLLKADMRLVYIDSDGQEDEILFDADGFKGFKILNECNPKA